jgi:hypothetical protein
MASDQSCVGANSQPDESSPKRVPMQCKLQNASCEMQIRDSVGRTQFAFCILHFAIVNAFPRIGTLIVIVLLLTLAQPGCIPGRQHPATTQPATAIDPKTAHEPYWLDQPAVAHITARNFNTLWNACRDVIRATGFTVDRTDYREGLLTTLPLVSKMPYEFWKSDLVTLHDFAQSAVGTVRRTVRFTIRRLADGSFQATPKVLVERDSMFERRITSVDQWRSIFYLRGIDVQRENELNDEAVPAEYWYAIGRDNALERQLAQKIGSRIKGEIAAR